MKKILVLLVVFSVAAAFGLDNAGWLAKARESVELGCMLDSDETPEDGIYCLSLAAIDAASDKPVDARIGTAVLEAKHKLTAYVMGQKVSAVQTLDRQSTSVTVDGMKARRSFSKYSKRIETKVNSFVRGVKLVGQITVSEKSYVVCVTCERFKDDSTILQAAQAEYGNEGVVKSVGEASTRDMALQKAIRGAVEQVLGTVVIGYDKMSSKNEFQKKVFSGTDGVVDKYRVLSEEEIPMGKRIEIVAKVSKKDLLENYSNYMKFLGNPAFYIESNSRDLASRFTDFFTGMGIRIASSPDKARFVIHCVGDFRPVRNPMNGRKGTQLSLRFKVQEINGTEVLIDMQNDPRMSACHIGDAERQRELCADKAFMQMKEPLHAKIQVMVGKLVGRVMEAAASDE